MTKSVVIRFVFNKGEEGEIPPYASLTEKEKISPSSMCYFLLNWDADAAGESLKEEYDGEFLEEYEIIYDGVSRYNKNEYGIEISDEEIIGYPAPIIKFVFSRDVNPKDFLTGIWESCVRIQSTAQKENEEDGFFFEDHNGYSDIVEQDIWIKELKENNVHIGKKITKEHFDEEICLDMSSKD